MGWLTVVWAVSCNTTHLSRISSPDSQTLRIKMTKCASNWAHPQAELHPRAFYPCKWPNKTGRVGAGREMVGISMISTSRN